MSETTRRRSTVGLKSTPNDVPCSGWLSRLTTSPGRCWRRWCRRRRRCRGRTAVRWPAGSRCRRARCPGRGRRRCRWRRPVGRWSRKQTSEPSATSPTTCTSYRGCCGPRSRCLVAAAGGRPRRRRSRRRDDERQRGGDRREDVLPTHGVIPLVMNRPVAGGWCVCHRPMSRVLPTSQDSARWSFGAGGRADRVRTPDATNVRQRGDGPTNTRSSRCCQSAPISVNPADRSAAWWNASVGLDSVSGWPVHVVIRASKVAASSGSWVAAVVATRGPRQPPHRRRGRNSNRRRARRRQQPPCPGETELRVRRTLAVHRGAGRPGHLAAQSVRCSNAARSTTPTVRRSW